jgi:alpha-1,3-glucan synthase
MDLGKSVAGCYDDWNSLDHFDPTTDSRRIFAQMFYLRTVYPALQDGWNLVQWGNWTYQDQLPGSNGTMTERGLWSTSRSGLSPIQNFSGTTGGQLWLLFSNVNETTTWTEDCTGDLWISSPFLAGTVVRNLFHPYENYTLAASLSPYYSDGKAPYYGCMGSITLPPMGFKVLVPVDQWVPPLPAITKFDPGHDSRIEVQDGSQNSTTVTVHFEFSDLMDCDSVTQSVSFNMSSSGHGGTPTVAPNSVQCLTMDPNDVPPAELPGVVISQWYWTATLNNVPDGILTITLSNPKSQAGVGTGVRRFSFMGDGGLTVENFLGDGPLPSPQGSEEQPNDFPRL